MKSNCLACHCVVLCVHALANQHQQESEEMTSSAASFAKVALGRDHLPLTEPAAAFSLPSGLSTASMSKKAHRAPTTVAQNGMLPELLPKPPELPDIPKAPEPVEDFLRKPQTRRASIFCALAAFLITFRRPDPPLPDTFVGSRIKPCNFVHRIPFQLKADRDVNYHIQDDENCWSTINSGDMQIRPWSWPGTKTRTEAIIQLREVLDSYPRNGALIGFFEQWTGRNLDAGGWRWAVDELDTTGYARIEYISGNGFFSYWFNEGKPFVDDLELEVLQHEVHLRSSSRPVRGHESFTDWETNAKRLRWLSRQMQHKCWYAYFQPRKEAMLRWRKNKHFISPYHECLTSGHW